MPIFWIFNFLLSASYCLCQVTYELNIYGEAQHGYFIKVYLGTPPQAINLLLDTGSSNVAVAAVPPNVGDNKFFHFNESKTLNKLDTNVHLQYIVGQWSGFLIEDVLNFGNGTITCTLACMVTINKIFEPHSQFQGLLGLAYRSIALPNSSVQPFFDTLIKDKDVGNIFSLDLCGPYFSNPVQATNCGKFEMGYTSKLSNNRDVVYTPIIKEWYYEIILTDLRVGMKHIPMECWEINKKKSVIDSGTTELYLPKSVYDWTNDEIRKHVQHIISDKFWMNKTAACVPYDKFDISVFPTLTLSFYHSINSSFNLLISPELYLLPYENKSTELICFKHAFAVLDDGVLIGSSILKGFYVVFDRQNKRIGFANSEHFNETSGFPGSVMKPKYTNKNIQMCKKEVKLANSFDLSPLMIVVLFFSVLVTLVLLYMLISWIFRTFLLHTDESSETSSLVDGIVLETWK
ncbi:beta-secretase 1-like isoform X2 [Argiope bruennichi]|uniref:Beta-secretase like protein n=1 Tax=Argiope bruennichi TaxID=94029 RepID=A0A8T0FYN2_ARGBR|nr:beta-secretase 1-like isoform X2 [Argiope bruennichi]KAF8795806.1 Beta-secretase like protein [Argiope bruennichi]